MAFNKLRESEPDLLEHVLFKIQQQAGVLGTLCMAVFGIITALKTGRLTGLSTSALSTPITPPSGSWGKRAAEALTT
jgi:hypothetical protein